MKIKSVQRLFALCLLAAWILCGCSAIANEPPEEPDDEERPAEDVEQQQEPPMEPELTEEEKIGLRAQEILDGMTLEEKVGQLFIIRPESLLEAADNGGGNVVTEWDDQLSAALARYPVGGFALFGQNIQSPDQLKKLIADIRQASPTAPLIGVDEEGGMVARIGGNDAFDVERVGSMADIGASGDPEQARAVGRTIGAYLAEYGFDLDFAPVADVNTNPDNVVIGSRAFGSDPQLVAEMVCTGIDGLHQSGIMSCVKHFPGHGDTREDTHDGMVSVGKTWDELLACELIPFIAALDTTEMVMVSHITTPNVTSDGLPASLSFELVTQRLRQELGYDGVVITDAMEMGAIAGQYTAAQGAVMAIEAGVDIVLMPQSYVDAFEGVVQAVQEGTLPETRVDESVLRILTLKITHGVIA